jgi:amidohydrolase
MGCRAEVEITSLTPAVINDPFITEKVISAAEELLPDHHLDTQFITMGSEDMAYILQEIPGCYFFVGSANADKGFSAPHHHPKFDIDESALPIASALMTNAAYSLLS